jgi:demethoxyubiquinone hydroxylase (CLK1/Coq7/Cat5 family)
MTQKVVLAVNTSAAASTPVYLSMTGAAAAAGGAQEVPRVLVPDSGDICAEQRRGAGVVGVVMRVDQVGDLAAHAVCGGDLVASVTNIAS